MPREGRLHIPGGCYHIIGRGLERRYIFDLIEDKENFLSRLGENLDRSQAQCLAWALMSNHYHLLIRAGRSPLSKLMAPLLSGYAGYYNRRHDRSGYVFQNRFKSILCDVDNYLKQLVRYIHRNPVRAGIVENTRELERYRWTGHAGVFGHCRQSWHDVDRMLEFFGQSRRAARNRYREFVTVDQPGDSRINLSGGGLVRSSGSWESLSRLRDEHRCRIGDERILGAPEFVARVLRQDELTVDLRTALERVGWDLEKLINHVCHLHDVSSERLLNKTRHRKTSVAKSVICYWGTECLGLSAREIATRLGLTHPAVSYRTRMGRRYCESKGVKFEDTLS